MGLLRKPDPPIVAVAASIPIGTIEAGKTTGEGWQSTAWNVWHDLGEIHYPTSQIARLVSRVDWVSEPNYDLEGLFEPPSLTEVARLVALNLEVAGEGWLILTDRNKKDQPIDLRWEVLAMNTERINQRLERAQVKVRFWNPDPEDPTLADSAVRAALGPASELLTLQALSRAQSRNRLATAGFLLRPNTRVPMVDDEGNPVDFGGMLQEAMTTAIQDENSAAAVVPIDVQVPPEEVEVWKFLIPDRPYDDKIDAKMERSIKRIALALDIWPELLLGIADVNHWNAWFLAEDTWQGHIAPLAEQVAATLEVAVLEATGDQVTITADPTELLARRSTVRDALDAAQIGAVSLDFVREAIGATDEDKPSEEDLEIIATMLGRGVPEEEESAEEEAGPPDTLEESEMPIAAAAGDVEEGLGVELAVIDDQLRFWLDGASEGVVDLARARVGMQVRSKLRGDTRAGMIDGVDNSEVVHTIGFDTASELLDLDAVVRATVVPLAERWEVRLRRAEKMITDLIGDIVPAEQWSLARKASVEMLVDDLTQFIVLTLGRTDSDMPTVDLRQVVAAAGV
jgi:hypothetical protein